MLEVSNSEIVFSFHPATPLISTINVRNSSHSEYLLFKMKTTAPELFEVNPSQGSLNPGQSKSISFKTTRVISMEEARELSSKQKFLIQSTPIKEEMKGDVKNLISKYNAENSSKVENIRLIIRIEGMEADVGRSARKEVTPSKINFDNDPVQTFDYPTDVRPTPELNRKLEQLERQEQRLIREKQEVFNYATKASQNKSSSMTMGKIMLFVLLFFVGLGANKVIRRQRIKLQQPAAATQHVEEIVYQRTETTTISYDPIQKEYEIKIHPPPKQGQTKDISFKISKDGQPTITSTT